MGLIVSKAHLQAALALEDARHFLFFPRNRRDRRAATDYFTGLAERTTDRDRPISTQARFARLLAITRAGRHAPDDLSAVTVPALVANGDHDLMVATEHSEDMASRLSDARLVIYPDAGHGGIFQNHDSFVPEVLDFLAA